MWNVLVSDPIHESGLNILSSEPLIKLENRPSMNRKELLEIVGEFHALVTRSGTPIDEEVLSRAKKLEVIARAGVGVDNIDLLGASRRGVVVINAPTGNTLAAAEHTMAMMLSLIRHVPQAFRSMSSGEWKRSAFTGIQLHGKKLLIIGLGRIGSQVALRCRSFGMELLAYDPYISGYRAERLGVAIVDDLRGALAMADIVTLHVPLTQETREMIGVMELKACRKGAFLVNCARGGLVNERACATALREGHLAGAAFDVFKMEPPSDEHPLRAKDLKEKVVLTPHLGANTREAQSAVSRIAVENLISALKKRPYEHAVNLPFLDHLLRDGEKEYLSIARKAAIIAMHLLKEPLISVRVFMRGPVFNREDESMCFELPYRYSPFTIASLKGALEVHHGDEVSYMFAPLLAAEKGIFIEEIKGDSTTYHNLLEISLKGEREEVIVKATVTEEGKQRIISINGYPVDFIPEGIVIIFNNHDRPGVIGKIGTSLGNSGSNIASFTLGRKNGSGLALGVLLIDNEITEGFLENLEDDADLLWAVRIDLRRYS